ncbi:MAG: chromosome segregation protein [Oscillospiraceae bacterium]|nr:chromosome segregation protein [Oscillospiraceae bacterium]
MYLKALEIQGFKSFPDKTVLSFGEDITAIVGPNGSGKSNLSDAIRWVMGEQSTRVLRGAKMEDVIFDGTEKRKGLGFAEVSLVLDNSDKLFDMEENEVMVTRRYYRSGESEYYINRRSVRLKDVNELFMDTGLGREGYSIIGQGKIDEILSVKSEDRREVFEEAAGISRFRHRKEEAERKLSRTEENLLRINDKIDELELQVEPLRIQSEKAKRFLILRDELRILEISIWLDQLEKLWSGAVKTNVDFEAANRQRDELRGAVNELYAAAEAYGGQMREKDIEMEQGRQRLGVREAEAGEVESAIAVLRNDIKNNAENTARVQQELEAQEGRAGGINDQINQRRKRLEEVDGLLEATCGELKEQRADSEALNRTAGTLENELEQLRRKEAMENTSASEARALLSALAAAAQELFDREEALGQELIAREEKRKEAETDRETLRAEHSKAREERDSLTNIISGYELRQSSRRKKLEDTQANVHRLQMEENNLNSRIHMLSEMEKLYEGYSKAVKLVMNEKGRGNLQGIHGPVAGLLHVPDQYTVAIEIALGGAMQHVVVEREEDGKAAIQYLKHRDGGRATFLPLSTIKPMDLKERGLDEQYGFIGIASGLVDYEPAYDAVFRNLLGRIVIAEDMDCAIRIARTFGHRFRIVTLDGQVLNAGGSMTGGSVSRSAGILSRANELERLGEQKAELGTGLKNALSLLEDARRELSAAAYELETAQGQRRELEDAILKLEGRLENADAFLADLAERHGTQRQELQQVKARSEQIAADTEAARMRISELEGAAAALRAEAEGKSRGQTDLKSRLERLQSETAALAAKTAALEAERDATAMALNELEALCRDITGDRQARLELIAEYEGKNQAISAEILVREQQLAVIRAENQSQNELIRRLTEEKQQLEGKRNRADKDSREKNESLLSMEREISFLEQKRSANAIEEKNILDRLWESYELSHEAAKAQAMELESVPKAARRISELKRDISALGNINLDAIEEFQRVNERYTYLTDQRDDVQKAQLELERIIRDITAEMTEIFRTQFTIINEEFGKTFVELFSGGTATLELEDEQDILNCGIEIKVQPPGKALKIITLLSGGEKAFVAIALYFAILKVRPTPFCVMDEIEAALDDVNVTRFAQYMRRMSDKTQFIVITHRRGTMEEADVLYGVTMQERGISRILTINLNEVERELKLKAT